MHISKKKKKKKKKKKSSIFMRLKKLLICLFAIYAFCAFLDGLIYITTNLIFLAFRSFFTVWLGIVKLS